MRTLLLSVFLLLGSLQTFGQDEKYKALYIYKFLRNLEFPEGKIGEAYKVGVVGNQAIYDELVALTQGRNVNGKSIIVSLQNPDDPISELCLLFLADAHQNAVDQLSPKAVENSVVLVGESPGLARKGVTLNFSRATGRLGFEMNAETLESSRIKCSSSLKLLATLVK